MEKETKQEEFLGYKPKLYIQYLTEEGQIVKERLIDQGPELNYGPKESWEGPLRIQFNLLSKDDIELVKNYLDKLTGKLPISTPKPSGQRGRPSTAAKLAEVSSSREDLFNEIKSMADNGSNQDDVIKYLRDKHNFHFLLTEDLLNYAPQLKLKSRDVGEPNKNGQYENSYQWMVKCLKMGADPRSDKYDPQIIFGFQIISERKSKFVCYLYGERQEPLKASIPSKTDISFNNLEMSKFPAYMIPEERLKFQVELRKLLNNTEIKPSKFILRWVDSIKFSKVLEDKIKAIGLL